MSPEAIALHALEYGLSLSLQIAPKIYTALFGQEPIADVLARARGFLPSTGSARRAIDDVFADHSSMASLAEAIRERTKDGSRATFVLDSQHAESIEALLASASPLRVPPLVTPWHEPGHEDD